MSLEKIQNKPWAQETRRESRLQNKKEPTRGLFTLVKDYILGTGKRTTGISQGTTNYTTFADISQINKESLETAYRRFGPVFRGINARAHEVVSPGFTIQSDDERGKRACTQFASKVGLRRMLRNWSIDTDTFGSGFLELIPSKSDVDKLSYLVSINPKTIRFKENEDREIEVDDLGTPKGIVQDPNLICGGFGETEEIYIPREQYAQLSYNTLSDQPWGIPLIEPMYTIVEKCFNMNEAMAEAIFRHGFARFLNKIGSSDNQPTPQELTEASNTLANLQSKSEITVPYDWDISILEPKEAKYVEAFIDYFLDQVSSCTGVPKIILMGKGESSNRAIAEVQARHYRNLIRSLQYTQSEAVERQIFKRVIEGEGLTEIPKLVWKRQYTKDDEDVTRTVTRQLETGIISVKEARRILGYDKPEEE